MSSCQNNGCKRAVHAENKYCGAKCYKQAHNLPETMPIGQCNKRTGVAKHED